MPAPSSYGAGGGHVPEIDELVAADGGEGGVVGGDGEVEDFVAVGAGVVLYELLLLLRRRGG